MVFDSPWSWFWQMGENLVLKFTEWVSSELAFSGTSTVGEVFLWSQIRIVQGMSCIITVLKAECTLDCSNGLHQDYKVAE